jgi:hypothetical protein
MRAPGRLALRESLMLAVIRGGQMVDAGEQCAEEFAVVDNAADRNAAEADAVITALAANEPRAPALAAHIVIGERDLERGVDRFRAGIAEEHAIEVARRQRRHPARQFEGFGMCKMKCGRVIEFGRLARNRRDDRVAVVAGIGAPQPRQTVEHRAPIRGEIMHVLGAGDQPRGALERPVGRKWQPKGVEIVGLSRAREIGVSHRHLSIG